MGVKATSHPRAADRAWRITLRADSSRRWGVSVAVLVGLASVACGAVYPELSSPLRPPPAGRELNPPPPEDLLFLGFKQARIPSTTRDGRKWDKLGGAAPDPYGVLFLNDRELFRTPVQSNTTNPTWPNQKKANYRIPRGSKLRIEVWDSNPVNNHPICVKRLSSLKEDAYQGEVAFDCDSGASVTLRVEPAHAKIGLGFYYELRTERIFISRVIQESPAGRLGVQKGDEILAIQDKPVPSFEEGDAQSLVNANASTGVKLKLRKPSGDQETLTVTNGPIYPLASDGIALD
ncbi:MAG: PDZ domain-containing protein [Myxococcales bacterium]|nr:PDZ domain-containing protein [Myxococcales bacterium]